MPIAAGRPIPITVAAAVTSVISICQIFTGTVEVVRSSKQAFALVTFEVRSAIAKVP